MKIVFVCTGNTCRSPMAEAFLNNYTNNHISISAGINAFENQSASKGSKFAMNEEGINLEFHKSKNINEAIMKENDLILTMTMSHKNILNHYFPEYREKIFTLSEYVKEKQDVLDPFGSDLKTYIIVKDQIKNLIKKLIQQLR